MHKTINWNDCTMSLCRFIWVSLGGFLYSNHSPSSMSAMRTMRIRLADVGDINTKIPKEPLQWKSRDVKRDNSERFFSSAARPRASAPRSVSVVAGKQHPLKARSSLASTLLFQSPDSNLVAAAALVQGLRQGPEVGWSLWEVKGTTLFILSQIGCIIFEFLSICSQNPKC